MVVIKKLIDGLIDFKKDCYYYLGFNLMIVIFIGYVLY